MNNNLTPIQHQRFKTLLLTTNIALPEIIEFVELYILLRKAKSIKINVYKYHSLPHISLQMEKLTRAYLYACEWCAKNYNYDSNMS